MPSNKIYNRYASVNYEAKIDKLFFAGVRLS